MKDTENRTASFNRKTQLCPQGVRNSKSGRTGIRFGTAWQIRLPGIKLHRKSALLPVFNALYDLNALNALNALYALNALNALNALYALPSPPARFPCPLSCLAKQRGHRESITN